MQYYLLLITSEQYQYGGEELFGKLPFPEKITNRLHDNEELFVFYGFTAEERKLISSAVKL